MNMLCHDYTHDRSSFSAEICEGYSRKKYLGGGGGGGVELNFFEGVPPMKLFFVLGHHH